MIDRFWSGRHRKDLESLDALLRPADRDAEVEILPIEVLDTKCRPQP